MLSIHLRLGLPSGLPLAFLPITYTHTHTHTHKIPLEDINEFLNRLDAILKYLYSTKSEFIICGDINVNYLNENNYKQQTLY
jgi:exonuclease III